MEKGKGKADRVEVLILSEPSEFEKLHCLSSGRHLVYYITMRIALTRQQHSSRIKSRNAYINKSRAIGYAAIIITA